MTQELVSEKDINELKINKKYIICFIILLILIILVYISFLYTWTKFFFLKNKLIKIIDKNLKSEKSCYESINIYHLMLFNNYTINEMYFYLAPNDEKNQNININIDFNSNIIFNNFYKSLYYIFESEKSCYESINIYHLMLFNNYSINEMYFYLAPNDEKQNININIDFNSNIIFNNFYKSLYYIFESEKEKKILGNIYQSFEYEFNCNNIYSTIKFNILEEIFQLFPYI